MTPGDHEASAISTLLARSGVRAPHTGAAWTEAMVFGLGGGIGFMHFTFVYDGHPPLASFVTRYHTKSGGYTGFADSALARTRGEVAVSQTTAASTAEKRLLTALAGASPVLCWVDDAALPSPADAAAPAGTSPWLVVASAFDPAIGEVTMGDPRRGELRVPLSTLTAARSAIRPLKHRAAVVQPSPQPLDLAGAVKEALRATAANMLEPEMRNFGLPGLAKWAHELADERGKRGWTALFPSETQCGATRAIARASHEAARGRLLYAAFLREAGAVCTGTPLTDAATGYEACTKRWRALEEAAERGAGFVALAAHVHEIETAERAAIRPLADWAA